MITVRFPSGHSVTYNSARNYHVVNSGVQLVDDSNHLIAFVLNGGGSLIEWSRPCKVQFGRDDEVIDAILADVHKFPSDKLAKLKKALRPFNAWTGSWK